MRRFVEFLETAQLPGARLVHHQFLPSRPAVYGQLKPQLAPPLQFALSHLGISRLYQHQVKALSHFRKGENVVIATPTASGKSLVYNLALMELLGKDPGGYGLYLFPLKALAQDQYHAFLALNEALSAEQRLRAAVYDGDTSPRERRHIKNDLPHLIISNPDMLHLGLLPYHQQWETFFRGLRLVVVDEVHTYRGIFGSHIAQIFRRLQRVCQLYGSNPGYILLSATIANAGEFVARLTGMRFQAVEENGAPQAGRHFFFVNPDLSAPTVAARLFVQALKEGLKTIAFTQARKLTEILHMSVTRTAPELASRVSSYRAGFLAEERREIERALASGAVTGIISTSALEMGVDIGGLDVCILVGYPGTIIDTWQRSGRVGRGSRGSVVILIAQPDALDQYFMRHPRDFFYRPFEAAVVDPDNAEVVDAHLPCAAAEIPLRETDTPHGYGKILSSRAPVLETRGELLRSVTGEEWYAARRQPQRRVDIRGVGPGYTIIRNDQREVIGKNDGVRVFRECHPGAIYLHRGQQYRVTRLDLKRRSVLVEPSTARYYTRPLSDKETEILEVQRSRPEGNFLARLGRLRVTEQIVGYEKRGLFSGELLESHLLDLETRRLAEEVGGWGNIHLMRLAVAVIYDQPSQRFEAFTEDRVEELISRLQGFDLVVGFNIKGFDYRVLSAYTPLDFNGLPTFDILEDIHGRIGFRLTLGHLAEQTLGKPKTADGIQAVRSFREGNLEAVIRYCKDDVAITRDLFEFGLSNGYLVYQTRQGQAVRLPVNWKLESILREVSR